jgi:hypothetical protein
MRRRLIALALPLMMAACGPTRDERAPDTRSGAPDDSGSVHLAGGAIASRGEAQDQLDAARRLLMRDDTTVAAAELRLAAEFFRRHADAAPGPAADDLRLVASLLQVLATDVAAGRVRDPAMLDSLYVLVQTAEAEYHRSIAVERWAAHDTVTTGEELVMAADHFERALRDSGRPLAGLPGDIARVAHSEGMWLLRRSPQSFGTSAALDSLGRTISDLRNTLAPERKP